MPPPKRKKQNKQKPKTNLPSHSNDYVAQSAGAAEYSDCISAYG